MVAAAFPWDVAIVAGSTLIAGIGATWWAGRIARATQTTQWRLEEQRAAAEQLLRAWSDMYVALANASQEDRRSPDGPPGRGSGPLTDFTEWVAALERLSLVADKSLVERAVALDTQVWQLHKRLRELGGLANVEWHQNTQPVHDARLDFVNTARRVLGSETPVDNTSGRPPLDDPLWSQDWNAERSRLEALRQAMTTDSSTTPLDGVDT